MGSRRGVRDDLWRGMAATDKKWQRKKNRSLKMFHMIMIYMVNVYIKMRVHIKMHINY